MENGIKPPLAWNVERGKLPSERSESWKRGQSDITSHATGEGACNDYRASDQLHRQSLPTHYRTRPRDELFDTACNHVDDPNISTAGHLDPILHFESRIFDSKGLSPE